MGPGLMVIAVNKFLFVISSINIKLLIPLSLDLLVKDIKMLVLLSKVPLP